MFNIVSLLSCKKTFKTIKALKDNLLTIPTTLASSSLNCELFESVSSSTNGSIKTAARITTGAETAAVVVLAVVVAAVGAAVVALAAATVVV